MIRPIVRDAFLLSMKAKPAGKQDIGIGLDLIDTLNANRARCVGMAANMIGVNKRIIIICDGADELVMFNPVVLRKEGPYETEEGCLSLDGLRKTTRYQTVEAEYTDLRWKQHRKKFTGYTAQILQHEMDHLEGILI